VHAVQTLSIPTWSSWCAATTVARCTSSRAPIPWPRDAFQQSRRLPCVAAHRHLRLSRGLPAPLVGWPVGALEKLESFEQLRALEHGVGIHG
jgi:CMP-2-keto-3-deoxyoctulosonic acid synthetase